MDFVLDEKVDQGHQCRKESATKSRPPVKGSWVWWAEHVAPNGPGQGRDEVRNHEDVVPVVVIGGGHVSPTTAGECSEDADSSDEFGERSTWACGENVPQTDQEEARTGSDGNEDLEDGSLRVAITNSSRYGWEPFDWITLRRYQTEKLVPILSMLLRNAHSGRSCGNGEP